MTGLNYREEEQGPSVRLILEGELDMGVANELRDVLRALVARNPPELVVDVHGVDFVDSSILATLIEAYKLLDRRGGRLKVARAHPAVRDVFELAGVAGLLGIS